MLCGELSYKYSLSIPANRCWRGKQKQTNKDVWTKNRTHTTVGIGWWSYTQVLAYLFQAFTTVAAKPATKDQKQSLVNCKFPCGTAFLVYKTLRLWQLLRIPLTLHLLLYKPHGLCTAFQGTLLQLENLHILQAAGTVGWDIIILWL